MIEIGVPLNDIYMVYDHLAKMMVKPWDLDEPRMHLLTVIFYLLANWFEQSPNEFPAEYVDKAITEYTMMLNSNPRVDTRTLANQYAALQRIIQDSF